MNQIQKLTLEKYTENGDKAYRSTGDNNIDLVFLAEYFSTHLKEASIGTSDKEKLLAMFIRDPRYGLGYKDLGRKLMYQSGVSADLILEVGRASDLWKIATDECLALLYKEAKSGNNLVKKWLPGLNKKDSEVAKALMKYWGLTPKQYRQLKKCDSTVEYKLSYNEHKQPENPVEELFNTETVHPLVNTIDFEKVPSLAMHKYLNTFSTREDIKPRFEEYLEDLREGKKKLNTATSTVHDAYKTSMKSDSIASNIIAEKTVEAKTEGVELSCLVILDSSGSMGSLGSVNSLISKASSVAHALAMKSTYCPGELIAFSTNPHFIKIKGDTLKEQYRSMCTGEIADTDFGKVMSLCEKLSSYPEYFICLTDMEFNEGSIGTKQQVMSRIKEKSPKTRIIWWNFNNRNSTSPELDEYGNIYMSGYNIQLLKFLESKFDMTAYLDKLLSEYKVNLNKQLKSNGKQEI